VIVHETIKEEEIGRLIDGGESSDSVPKSHVIVIVSQEPNRNVNDCFRNSNNNARFSMSSGVSSCDSMMPVTRADLPLSRKVFFQDLDNIPDFPVTSV